VRHDGWQKLKVADMRPNKQATAAAGAFQKVLSRPIRESVAFLEASRFSGKFSGKKLT